MKVGFAGVMCKYDSELSTCRQQMVKDGQILKRVYKVIVGTCQLP